MAVVAQQYIIVTVKGTCFQQLANARVVNLLQRVFLRCSEA